MKKINDVEKQNEENGIGDDNPKRDNYVLTKQDPYPTNQLVKRE